MVPTSLSSGFQSFTLLLTIKLSGAGSRVGGLVHALAPCGSLQRPRWESLLLLPQPPRALSIRGLRLYFPALEPWVTQSALLPAVRPGLSVRECGAAGCYPPLCLPHSLPLLVRPSRFLCARMWGCGVLPDALPALFSATLSPALLVFLCTNVGPQGLLVVRLPAPFVPHSTSLGPATATRVLSAPAACLRPSYQSG